MTTSSFDARISQREFDKKITLTLAQNKSLSETLKRDFTDRLDRETLLAKNKFGEKSPQYAQFLRSTLVFAERYTADMTNLDSAFDILRAKAIESVGAEQAGVEKSTQAKFDAAQSLMSSKWDLALARAMNPISVSKMLTGAEWEFQAYSPEERTRIGAKTFNMANVESWKETTFLLGAEFANSVKDIALFFTSIPGSIALLPRFAYLRANRHESMENEAMLAQMLKEFPALALVDLASDWDKAVMVLKEVASKMASGKQEDIAFAIVNVVGLLAGGALLAGKLGGSAGKLARLASSGTTRAAGRMAQVASTTTNAAVRAGARVAEIGAKWVAVGTLGVAGMATAGEVGLSRVASIAGRVDNVASGQFAVNAAAEKVANMVGGAQFGDTEGLTREGRMSKEESLRIARSNQGLNKADRVDGVEVLLNVKLSPTQAAALEKAHITQAANSRGIGEFTLTELRAKTRILQKEGGFTPEQIRLIMEHWYAGKVGDGFMALIEDGKLTLRRLIRWANDSNNAPGGIDVRIGIPPEQKARAFEGAEDIEIIDRPPSVNGTQNTTAGSQLSVVPSSAAANEIRVGENVAQPPSSQVMVDGVQASNKLDAQATNPKNGAAIQENVSAQWITETPTDRAKIDGQARVEYQQFTAPFYNWLPQDYRVSTVDGKPFVEIKRITTEKGNPFSNQKPNQTTTWEVVTDEKISNMGQSADNLRARIDNEFNTLQNRAVTENKWLLEAAQIAKDAELKYQQFTAPFYNWLPQDYRVSTVDGKPFVEIKRITTEKGNPFSNQKPNQTTTWEVVTDEKISNMGQSADNLRARIDNEFNTLLAKQKEASLSNKEPSVVDSSAQQLGWNAKLQPDAPAWVQTVENGDSITRVAQRNNAYQKRLNLMGLSPQELSNRIALAKKEWGELVWRKSDLEKNLAANTPPKTPDQITQLKKDIDQLEKKIIANKADQNGLNKELDARTKAAAEDLAQREWFQALTPADRTAKIVAKQREWADLASQKADLEKLLNAGPNTPDRITDINRQIGDLDKKILGNQVLQNNLDKWDRLASQNEGKLGELWLDAAALMKAAETPAWRKSIGKYFDELKQSDYKKYLLAAAALLALLYFVRKCTDGVPMGGENPPAADSSGPFVGQIEIFCGEDSGADPSIIADRFSDVGAKLTEKTRESISKRWMKWEEWTALVKLFERSHLSLNNDFIAEFQTVQETPSAENVKELQRWIKMESKDQRSGQDGILGPLTTGSIADFINRCNARATAVPKATASRPKQLESTDLPTPTADASSTLNSFSTAM